MCVREKESAVRNSTDTQASADTENEIKLNK